MRILGAIGIGNHEKFVYANGSTKNLFYIFGGKELTGIYMQENSTSQLGYVITDHLGSVWALANEGGGFIENYAYDAWGRRMNPTNWAQADIRTVFKTDRGFTLHVPYCSKSTSEAQYFWQTVAIPNKPERSGGFIGKHYDHMQIINMVARMYDPLLGQFISVDPLYAKYPGVSAYTYCMNNPVAYWDPTGEATFDKDGNKIDDNGGKETNYFKVGRNTFELPRKEVLQGAREVLNAANSPAANSALGSNTREFAMTFDNKGNSSGLIKGNEPEKVGMGWKADVTIERNFEGKGEASIHAHPTGTVDIENPNFDEKYRDSNVKSMDGVDRTTEHYEVGMSARVPSEPNDKETFENFEQNIIVGNKDDSGNTKKQGAAFFGNDTKMDFWMDAEALEKILNTLEEL